MNWTHSLSVKFSKRTIASWAILTILDESAPADETALLSEQSLAEDWNRPEEDAAWSYLQLGK